MAELMNRGAGTARVRIYVDHLLAALSTYPGVARARGIAHKTDEIGFSVADLEPVWRIPIPVIDRIINDRLLGRAVGSVNLKRDDTIYPAKADIASPGALEYVLAYAQNNVPFEDGHVFLQPVLGGLEHLITHLTHTVRSLKLAFVDLTRKSGRVG